MYGSMEREVEEEIPLPRSPNIGGISFIGCKWRVATDDMVFTSWIEVLSRLLGLILLTSLYFSEYTDPYIQHYGVNEYLIGYGVICILISINLTFLGWNSMEGYIWDERPNIRVFVLPLLYVNLVFIVGELFWLSYGSHIIHQAWINSDNIPESKEIKTLVNVTLAFITFSWIGIIAKVSLSFMFFKKFKNGHTVTKYIHQHMSTARTFRIIGDTISFFFHDADFVPTDTAAALFLLDLYKKKYSDPEASRPSADLPQDYDYAEIEHYMKYSSSIYGCFHLPLLKKMRGFARVLGKGSCFCCFKERRAVELEGPCSSIFDMFAIFHELPFLTPDSFLFVNFTNQIGKTPYMVVLDKDKKKIVITIRGSMSFNDAITDLLVITTQIDGYENYFTHGGIMDAARNIHQELRDKEILEKALVMNPGYDLVVTGHSLGAGVAVVLTFLLRIFYKSTICYAFSCPVCLNEYARVESEEFVIHVVFGDDIFPRLTPTNFALLVNQMRHILRNSKVPKYKILGLKIFSCFFSRIISLEDTLLHRAREEEILPRKMLINKYNRKYSNVLDLSLLLPGRIIHITKDQDEYFVKEITHSFFSQIEISTRMTFDHLPINLLLALNAIKRRKDTQNDPTV